MALVSLNLATGVYVLPVIWRAMLPLFIPVARVIEFNDTNYMNALYMVTKETENTNMSIKLIDFSVTSQKAIDIRMKEKNMKTHFSVIVDPCSQDERRQLLHFHCQQNEQLPMTAEYFGNLYVNQQHKLVACLPPKAGSSTWKTIIANNTRERPLPRFFDVINLHRSKKIRKYYDLVRLIDFKPEERQRILEQMLYSNVYIKFLVTRHPFERVYSAYVHKLKSGKDPDMQREHGSRILNKFHPELPLIMLNSGMGVTFKEFIDYIKLNISSRRSFQHWDAAFDVCQPCHINYDYIVKAETMDEDNELIIKKHLGPYHRGIGTGKNIHFRAADVKQRAEMLTSHGRLLTHFASLNQTDIEYLVKRFQHDFRYFGYSSAVFNDNSSAGVVYNSCTHGALNRQCC